MMPDGTIAPVAPFEVLTPRPGRPWWWIALNSARGTWFLVMIHVGAVAIFFTGVNRIALIFFPAFLVLRGMVTTVCYHRYFAHRSFKTSRVFQFLLACLCCTNLQRGPLWWSAIHRHHHRHSDAPGDTHSPILGGVLWSYGAWMFATLEQPDWNRVRDLRRFPELVWLERFWLIPPLLLVTACWLVGGWSMVCVCFCLTAVLTLHGASAVNTLGHLIGSRRYPTPDSSRNSFLLAMVTFGDGWHNNHHHYPHAARAGFFWWEIDGAYRLIRLMERCRLVWDVRQVPPHKLVPPPAGAKKVENPVRPVVVAEAR
jgi:stearoyl-CoA desaturase (Delta-9 desaturase)